MRSVSCNGKVSPSNHYLKRFLVVFCASWGTVSSARFVESACEYARLVGATGLGQAPLAIANNVLLGTSGAFAALEGCVALHNYYNALSKHRDCSKVLSKHANGHMRFVNRLTRHTKSETKRLPTPADVNTTIEIDASVWEAKKQAEAFCAYELAAIEQAPLSRNLFEATLTLTRESLLQGGLACASIARTVAEFAPRALINISAVSIAKSAFSIAVGASHLIIGGIAYSMAKTDQKIGKEAQKIVHAIQSRLNNLHADNPAEQVSCLLLNRKKQTIERKQKYANAAEKSGRIANAIEIAQQLTALAYKGSLKTQAEAEKKKSLAGRRMCYGTLSLLVGVASLLLFLLMGSNPFGLILMVLISAIGILASAFWMYQSARDQYDKLQAEKQAALVSDDESLTVTKQALAFLQDENAFLEHKLIKAVLYDLGLPRHSLTLLKVSEGLGVTEVAKNLLEKQVCNLISSNGARWRQQIAEKSKEQAQHGKQFIYEKRKEFKKASLIHPLSEQATC